METRLRGLGRCSCAFWLAVAFDTLGLIILMIGVFADLFFYDFLIYAGAIIIFLSLIWWVFWYTGNIEVPPEELEDDVGLLKRDRGIAGVIRRLSSRLSYRVRNSFRRNGGVHSRGGDRDAMPQQPMQAQGQAPVTLPMAQCDNLHTVSAAVDGEPAPISTTETSAI
ncbi:transmembrane protein 238-like [Conger conger]|uniref:transmembrane protein 238-like n=1 Tax=Conger conger TaxID=82655 RepID=UPI002A5A2238|nr:transmembrane protein 238-like [Conger conger]